MTGALVQDTVGATIDPRTLDVFESATGAAAGAPLTVGAGPTSVVVLAH